MHGPEPGSHAEARHAVVPAPVEHALASLPSVEPRLHDEVAQRATDRDLGLDRDTPRAAPELGPLEHRGPRPEWIVGVDPELGHRAVAALDVSGGREARESHTAVLVEAGARARDDVTRKGIRLHLPLVFTLGDR